MVFPIELIKAQKCSEGEDIGQFITIVPKVLLLRFLIRWFNNLNFNWLVY